jgi:hypothetical protein
MWAGGARSHAERLQCRGESPVKDPACTILIMSCNACITPLQKLTCFDTDTHRKQQELADEQARQAEQELLQRRKEEEAAVAAKLAEEREARVRQLNILRKREVGVQGLVRVAAGRKGDSCCDPLRDLTWSQRCDGHRRGSGQSRRSWSGCWSRSSARRPVKGSAFRSSPMRVSIGAWGERGSAEIRAYHQTHFCFVDFICFPGLRPRMTPKNTTSPRRPTGICSQRWLHQGYKQPSVDIVHVSAFVGACEGMLTLPIS